MVRGIKFVGIPVRDQDVSLKFYTSYPDARILGSYVYPRVVNRIFHAFSQSTPGNVGFLRQSILSS
jgi:hypothetical protein